MVEFMSTNGITQQQEEYLRKFFELYDNFLQIDAVVSVVKGREYALIKRFYEIFFKMSMEKIPNDIDSKVDELRKVLEYFRSTNEEYVIDNLDNRRRDGQQPNIRSTRAVLQRGSELSKAFKNFVKATNHYVDWREKIPEAGIKTILEKNLKERNKFYNCEIEYKIIKNPTNQNKMLKQSLVEFFNAISHLNTIYWNRADAEKNNERAINHFNRGTLDIYKAIIKDFFYLIGSCVKPDEFPDIIKELKNIRKNEYDTTGNDSKRNNTLIKGYKEFVEKIQKLWKGKPTS